MYASIKERLATLKTLHEHGIHTILLMSPIFPEISNVFEIIEVSRSYIDEYYFDNLNLRGAYKQDILTYIDANYPQLNPLYTAIHKQGDKTYWTDLSMEIKFCCELHHINYINYFYHEELGKETLDKQKKFK